MPSFISYFVSILMYQQSKLYSSRVEVFTRLGNIFLSGAIRFFPPYTCPEATYICVSLGYPIARNMTATSPGSRGQRPSFLF